MMGRREFVVLLATGIAGLAFPRICPARVESKEIIIRRDWQIGGAYENGVLQASFPIMFGDDEGRLATPSGIYRILEKLPNYHSRKYDAPMPFSLCFTRARNAIHSRGPQFKMPELAIRRCCRTHGCVTVEHRTMAWLFDWTPLGTKLTILGDRGY